MTISMVSFDPSFDRCFVMLLFLLCWVDEPVFTKVISFLLPDLLLRRSGVLQEIPGMILRGDHLSSSALQHFGKRTAACQSPFDRDVDGRMIQWCLCSKTSAVQQQHAFMALVVQQVLARKDT